MVKFIKIKDSKELNKVCCNVIKDTKNNIKIYFNGNIYQLPKKVVVIPDDREPIKESVFKEISDLFIEDNDI